MKRRTNLLRTLFLLLLFCLLLFSNNKDILAQNSSPSAILSTKISQSSLEKLIVNLETVSQRLSKIATRINSRLEKISEEKSFTAKLSNTFDKKNDELILKLANVQESIAALRSYISSPSGGVTKNNYGSFRAKVVNIRSSLTKIVQLEQDILTDFKKFASSSALFASPTLTKTF